MINSGSETSQGNNFNITPLTIGADQEDSSLTFKIDLDNTQVTGTTGGTTQQLTVNGVGLNYFLSQDKLTLTASTATTENNVDNDNTAYTVEIKGDANNGFTYDITTLKTLDTGSSENFTNNLQSPGAGNFEFLIVNDGQAIEALYTGFNNNSVANPNAAETEPINTNANNISAGANVLRPDFNLVIDFGEFSADSNAANGYTINERVDAIAPSFALTQNTRGSDFTVTAIDAEGTSSTSTNTGNTGGIIQSIESFQITDTSTGNIFSRNESQGSNGNIIIGGETVAYAFNSDGSLSIEGFESGNGSTVGDSIKIFGDNINRVVIQNDGGNNQRFAVTDVEIDGFATADPITTNLGVVLADGDGDQSESDFKITFNPDSTTNSNPPIAVDLDGNGISYLSLKNGIQFTDTRSLQTIQTAWVASNDGILVYDANQSGNIESLDEFVFTRLSIQASTDLGALAEVFDTNQDGVLNALDAEFESFAIWQDLNSDGISDDGELIALSDLGIKSVDLSYFEGSQSRIDADGDVEVFGQFNINYEDGSIGLAEDASFAFNSISEEQESLDSDIANSSNMINDEITSESISSSEEIDYSAGELVDQFLAINTVDNEQLSEIQQELNNTEIDLNTNDSEVLSNNQDASYEDNMNSLDEPEVEADLDMDIIESIMIENFDATVQTNIEDDSLVYS